METSVSPADRLAAFEFAASAPKFQTVADLNQAFQKLIGNFGLDTFVSVRVSNAPRSLEGAPGTPIGHLPTLWLGHYYKSDYVRVDPVIRKVLDSDMAFYWSEAMSERPLNEKEKLFVGEASEFGLQNGIIVPIRLFSGALWVVTITGEHVEQHPDVLLAVDFTARAYAGAGMRLLPPAKIASGKASLDLQSPLTRQQQHVLLLIAEGLSAIEVAEELEISERTVQFHLAEARQRLGVRNTTALVATALRTGKIN